ncbi:MAG: ABC transporter permease [Bacteroidia bacterium]|nr:ABC transporter permease [Bacteroidia bacterium]
MQQPAGSISPARRAWQHFRRNPLAMTGLIFTCLIFVVTVPAYLFTPDATTHANMQVLELGRRPPGTRVTLLLLPLGTPTPVSPGWIFTGKPADYQPVPVAGAVRRRDGYICFETLAGNPDSLALDKFGPAAAELPPDAFSRAYVRDFTYLLGTDSYGRDLLSRLLVGGRVSLAVGLMAVWISLALGILAGLLAGYLGGWVDRAIMWLVSVLWSIPTLLLALVLSFILGRGFWQLFVAIGASMWVEVARLVRGQILSVRELQYVEAARAMGFGAGRVMWRHVLPNVFSPIIVMAVANFGSAVLVESGMSFLGIGVEPPVPSWGRMVYEGYTYIVFENGKWLAFFPGLALVLLIVAINLVGIGLRDALDVRK